MLTSDTDGWGAAGVPGAADEPEKISTEKQNHKKRQKGWVGDKNSATVFVQLVFVKCLILTYKHNILPGG